MINRRHFCGSIASAAALLGLGGIPSAAVQNPGRRFLFVFANGGWDPLCVFAPLFDANLIDMEPEAQRLDIGDFRLVDHPLRPSVPAFFRQWGDITCVLNGISTRSVAHEACTEIAMTGGTSGIGSDWPTWIANAQRDQYSLPSLVLGGPSFPGDQESVVSRAGGDGELDALLTGDFVYGLAKESEIPGRGVQRLLDRFVQDRVENFSPLDAHATRLKEDFRNSMHSLDRLKAIQSDVSLLAEDFATGARAAVKALSTGLSRVVCLEVEGEWDSHEDNSVQTPAFETLFPGLSSLLEQLQTTPGPTGTALLDDTVVVVLSEMGRTPRFNETGGRDHWPYTTAMLIGNDIAGGRTLGGFTDRFSGIGVHPTSGASDPDQTGIAAVQLGATLLELADIDPRSILRGVSPISAVLKR